ncbi:11713_t:CDS:1, partial [Gigaspora rosea]
NEMDVNSLEINVDTLEAEEAEANEAEKAEANEAEEAEVNEVEEAEANETENAEMVVDQHVLRVMQIQE